LTDIYQDKTKDVLVASSKEPLSTAVFPWYSVVHDTGALVAALIRAVPGKKVVGVNEWLSIRDLSKLIALTLGKGIEFTDDVSDMSVGGDIDLNLFRQELMEFAIEFGYSGEKVDKTVLKPEDLGESIELGSVKKWFEKQDWEKFIHKA